MTKLEKTLIAICLFLGYAMVSTLDYQDEVAYQEYQCEMVNSGVWVDYEVKGCDEQK